MSKLTEISQGYTMPKLSKGQRWFVEFYAIDPECERLKRKRYYIDMGLKTYQRKQQAAEMIDLLAKKLRWGWNPWAEGMGTRCFITFETCLQKYEDEVQMKDKKKTRQTYLSKVKVLKEFIEICDVTIRYAYQFDSVFCNEFLDWMRHDRGVGIRTRNNYKGWLGSLGAYMLERGYISINPVKQIRKLPQYGKQRKDLSQKMINELSMYLLDVDKPFFLACMMQYYTLIRPAELTRIRIRDISVKKQTVFVSGLFSKNHKDATVGLNSQIVDLMIDLKVLEQPGDYYLFGKGFLPSADVSNPDMFNRRWTKMRKELGWEDCYKFYSLKDTGIRDLANECGVVVARDQARHEDVETTNKYIQKHSIHNETLSFKGKMSYKRENTKQKKDTTSLYD